jgi:hypothetical protein
MQVHGFFAEFANHCPMTYGTWYSSTHIRHAVAPADPQTGLPSGPFVPRDVAIARAAGNPALMTKMGTTRDGFHVLFTTNQRFARPIRNCTGVDPTKWHTEAVVSASSLKHFLVNLILSVLGSGVRFRSRLRVLEFVAHSAPVLPSFFALKLKPKPND